MFLDGHVGEVHEHVVQFTGAGRVFDRAEAAEAQFVPETQSVECGWSGAARWRAAVTYSHVALQRPVAGHQHIQTQVELLPADQQRVVDVQRDDVGLLPTVRRHEPVKHTQASSRRHFHSRERRATEIQGFN